jgi:hypothetical protein
MEKGYERKYGLESVDWFKVLNIFWNKYIWVN